MDVYKLCLTSFTKDGSDAPQFCKGKDKTQEEEAGAKS